MSAFHAEKIQSYVRQGATERSARLMVRAAAQIAENPLYPGAGLANYMAHRKDVLEQIMENDVKKATKGD